MANKKSASNESTKATTKKTTSSTKTTTKKTTTTTKKGTATKSAPKATSKTTTKVQTPTTTKVEEKIEVKKPIVKEEKTTSTKAKELGNNLLDWANENIKLIGGIIIALLLIINIVLIANGHKVKLSNGNEVIASVDGKEFVAEDLFEELKNLYGSNSLLNLVDEYIISQEVKDDTEAKKTAQENVDAIRSQYESAGYEWETVLTQYGYENEDALLKELMLSIQKEEVAKNYLEENLTDEEINKYYNEEVFGTYTVKHILIKPSTSDGMSAEEVASAEEAAKARAMEVISRLNNGEDFGALVSEYSQDEGSVQSEGLIENFTKGDVVDEFFNASVNLKDGEYSAEPVKSTYGYHVILRVSATEKKALEDIKDEVVESIIERKLNEDATLYTQTWVNIRKKYNFVINDTKIKEAYEKAINN